MRAPRADTRPRPPPLTQDVNCRAIRVSRPAALAALLTLKATDALVVTVGSDDRIVHEERVPIELVQCGDILQVGPGEKIAVDGLVVWGSSYVDESMVTGESVAVPKLVNRFVTPPRSPAQGECA